MGEWDAPAGFKTLLLKPIFSNHISRISQGGDLFRSTEVFSVLYETHTHINTNSYASANT